jgi:hypothetical protein
LLSSQELYYQPTNNQTIIMKNNISQITVLGLLAAALIALPASSRAEGTNPPAAPGQSESGKPKKHHPPFNGKVGAVDVTAKTLTVGTLTLQVTPETKITKNGKPATLADGVVGEPVSGAYKKTAEGKLDAISIHFGAKGERKNKEATGAGNN